MQDCDFEAMLKRFAKRATPRTVIDVGASNGCWSGMARQVWPGAGLVCVEANRVFADALAKRLAVLGGKFRAEFALASNALGTCKLKYHDEEPRQGVDDAADGILMPVTTLDMAADGFDGPYLIKLDVHGREPDILRGARRVLGQTVGIVVEVYTWPVHPTSLRMVDLLPVIEELGFLPTDLANYCFRPRDGRLCSVDMLFEPKTAPNMMPAWE